MATTVTSIDAVSSSQQKTLLVSVGLDFELLKGRNYILLIFCLGAQLLCCLSGGPMNNCNSHKIRYQ